MAEKSEAKKGWGTAKETVDTNKGSGLFVRLSDDGDKIVGAFCGEPLTKELAWDPKKEKYEDYTPKHKEEGVTMSPRFIMNFFVPADPKDPKSKAEMKIIEMNLTTFSDVLAVKDKYGLSKAFEIVRNGKKGNQKTKYKVLYDRDLTEAEIKQVGKAGPNDTWIEGTMKLHDLEKNGKSDDDDDDDKTDLSSHDKKKSEKSEAKAEPKDAFISSDLASDLAGRLKVIPRELANKFLAKFKVAKVKEVAVGDAKAAQAFVVELEAEAKKASEPAASEDPFG